MQLQHPNIESAFALENVEGLGLCIVMEYIEGSTLKEWLQGDTLRQTRQRIARELTEAVGYIHSKGIVHRDLKPENIIITHNGENVKLIDFGLADTDSHAVLKQPAGTPRYMPPEQLQTSVADVRNDIYSLGIIFQQMKLGLGYRSIIKRCIQPINRRYPNVQTLQKAVVRQKACVRWGMILAVALLLLITIASLVALGLRQKEQTAFIREQQGIIATQQTEIKQQRHKMDSLQQQVGESVDEMTDYQKRQQRKEEDEQRQEQSQERMSKAFMAGIDSQDWDEYLQNSLLPKEQQSSPVLTRRLSVARNLTRGDRLRLMWQPGRICDVEYTGDLLFRVISSAYTRLHEGDTFECSLIIEGEPLYLDNLKQGNHPTIAYVCGKKSGVMFEFLL